jgi:hypothetical protein
VTFPEAMGLCDHVNSNTPKYYRATLFWTVVIHPVRVLLLIEILKKVSETRSSIGQKLERVNIKELTA